MKNYSRPIIFNGKQVDVQSVQTKPPHCINVLTLNRYAGNRDNTHGGMPRNSKWLNRNIRQREKQYMQVLYLLGFWVTFLFLKKHQSVFTPGAQTLFFLNADVLGVTSLILINQKVAQRESKLFIRQNKKRQRSKRKEMNTEKKTYNKSNCPFASFHHFHFAPISFHFQPVINQPVCS